MNLEAAISLDNRGFLNPLAQAQQAVSGAVGNMKSTFAGLTGILAGVGALGGAFAGVKIAIDKAADMESLETSFAVLLGSMDNAKSRMKELSKFAADTPFELPEVAAASRTLETLTRGALSTGQGLTLIGDVASGTQQPFAELAVTVGRLYDGLQNGRAVGESQQRLQELGVISGTVRSKLEEMQSEGKKGNEVWSVAAQAMGRFTGMMKMQSGTWHGLMSTLQDNIGAVFREFGTPLIDSLKPVLQGAISLADRLAPSARAAGEALAGGIGAVRALFQAGELSQVAFLSLQVGFGKAVNFLAGAAKGTFLALAGLLGDALTGAMQAITSASGWHGLGMIFRGLGSQLSASIKMGLAGALEGVNVMGIDVMPKESADLMKSSAGTQLDAASAYVNSGIGLMGKSLAGAGAGLINSLASAGERFKVAVADTKIIDVSEGAKELGKLWDKSKAIADATRNAVSAAVAASVPTGGQQLGTSAVDGPSGKVRQIESDRLAKVGLFIGGSGGPSADHARRTADHTGGILRVGNLILTALTTRPIQGSNSTFQ